MLVTLAELKTYLGISDTSQDDWLNQQNQIISDSIEGYCGRKFNQTEYEQTFYSDEVFPNRSVKTLDLFHYPVIAISEVLDGDEDVTADVRTHFPTGRITNLEGFFKSREEVKVTYEAGFSDIDIPSPVKSVVMSIIQERYNKKQSGVSLDFGADVQRISIPGTISIDFDYSLQSNERSVAYGTILGNHVNVLDAYRSERAIIGSSGREYVVEV